MKLIVAVVILSVSCPLFCLSQQEPDQPQRYSYQVTGSVLDTDSQPMARITVCFEPSERPINGRVPCAKTTDGGRFSVGAEDVPDKYRVCASTVDSPVPLNTDPSEKQPRTKCTEPMEFGAQDESREVTIQFEAEEASQIGTSLPDQDLPMGRGHDALPRAFLEAKTVNLVDYSGYQAVGDALKREIEDWGRYTIAENPEDADLMFVISRWQKPARQPDSGSNAIPPVNRPFPEAIAGATSGRLVLEVNDNKTGTPLWSAYHKRDLFRSAVRALLDELRAQIEVADTKL